MIQRPGFNRFAWLTMLLLPIGTFMACSDKARTVDLPTVPPSNEIDNKQDSTEAINEQHSNRFAFVDVARHVGIEFAYRNGVEAGEVTMVESLGGGVAVFDFDRDGLRDLFFPGGGLIEHKQLSSLDHGLFRNLGNFKFANVTRLASINKGQHYSHGPAVADYDNDGFEDVVITGYGGIQFLRNQGDGTFQELAPSGLNETLWSSSAGWADLNGDQLLDLYICHYLDWS